MKKTGNGFVFRLIQAIVYFLTTAGVLVVFIMVSPKPSMSLTEYIREKTYYIDDYRQTDMWSEHYKIAESENGEIYLSLERRDLETDNTEITIYNFESEDAENETILFINPLTQERITLEYSQFDTYVDYVSRVQEEKGTATIFLILCAALTAVSALQFFLAFRGKKSVAANNFCIFLNILFTLCNGYGILGLIGGIKGRASLLTEHSQTSADEQTEKRPAEENMPSENIADEPAAENDSAELCTQSLDYIRPKMSVKGKKVIMAILIISYSLLLISGILLLSVPSFNSVISAIGICDESAERAYAVMIGTMWLALIPTFGYYFSTLSPYDIGVRGRVVIALITTALLVATNAAFFIVINFVNVDGGVVKTFFEGEDVWFMPLSMVFASLCTAICYALTMFRLNPENIRDVDAGSDKETDLFNVIKHTVLLILGLVIKLIKGILKFKEKQPDIFILISTILLTWLAFFVAFLFAIICIVVLVGVSIMYFAGFINWAYIPSNRNDKKVKINDGGTVRTLTLNPNFVEERYEEVYEDELGNRWYSRDGGKTVYKKN